MYWAVHLPWRNRHDAVGPSPDVRGGLRKQVTSPDLDLIDTFVSGASAPPYDGRMISLHARRRSSMGPFAVRMSCDRIQIIPSSHLRYFRDESRAVPIDIDTILDVHIYFPGRRPLGRNTESFPLKHDTVVVSDVSRPPGKQCGEDRPGDDHIVELKPVIHLCLGHVLGLRTAKPVPQCGSQDRHQTQRHKNRRVHLAPKPSAVGEQ